MKRREFITLLGGSALVKRSALKFRRCCSRAPTR
jgi:hypothetical protein